MPVRTPVLSAALVALLAAAPAQADELFVGVAAHGVDTPFTFDTGEGGSDIQLGYRGKKIEALSFLGRPEPYVFSSVNTDGNTNFVAAGLSWTLGDGPVYVRPGVGLALHDAPSRRVDFATGLRTDLGSRVLFEPEMAIGYRASERLSVEASWVHISNARIFNSEQNPGIDAIGVRVNIAM